LNIDLIAKHELNKNVQSVSLLNKQLPELNEFKIDISSSDYKNRMILICFFDYQQRPSRNCIIQLSKEAQELKAKDVAIVAINASKIEQNTRDEFVKKNEITFPVGMIESDSEKTQFNWGVKSLPWLILTDKKRVVQGEGLGIDDIVDKIKNIKQ